VSKKLKKNGILFWITGLSGSGKTSIANEILPFVKKRYGPTIHLDGDALRNILDLRGYSLEERLSNSAIYTKIAKYLTSQGINVVFSLVGLMNKPRAWNRKNIKKYIEIYVRSDLKKIISKDIKKIYRNKKNIVGLTIKPEFPKKPDIIIDNTFDKNLTLLGKELMLKISKFILKKKYAD
jgi:adenylylsulfate kinase|tara:strand:+ start:23 stop:562 length:540 start_codon:yes stop_codon:yes gene_type:complete